MKRLLCLCLLAALVTSSCSKKQPAEELYNAKASTPAGAAFNPIGGVVITSYLDPKAGTTATLFGNDVAMKGTGSAAPYAPGTELRLVTWRQQADPNWFGARIPAQMESVETVTFMGDGSTGYERRNGAALAIEGSLSEAATKQRTEWISQLRQAVMP